MGKAARNRRLRAARQQEAAAAEQRLRQQGDTGPMPAVTSAARQLMGQALAETEMPCRATFLDCLFPGAGVTAPVTGIADDGTPVFDVTADHDRIPVMMFEPELVVMAEDTVTGTVHDMRAEALISGGFTRVPPMAFLTAMPADGWQLHRTADGAALIDPYGGMVAEGDDL